MHGCGRFSLRASLRRKARKVVSFEATRRTLRRGGEKAENMKQAAGFDAEPEVAADGATTEADSADMLSPTPTTTSESERGAATAEYAIVIMAAVGFAGLLVVIMRSSEVRAILTDLVQRALTFAG